MLESNDHLAEDFAAFNRDLLGLGQRADFHVMVARLVSLRERLGALLVEDSPDGTRTTLRTVATTEIHDLDARVTWLKQHVDSGDPPEILRRLILAVHQGWTVAELIQRAHVSLGSPQMRPD